MPPIVALLLCVIFIFYLFKIDSTLKSNISAGLWIPLIWMLIIGSREVSLWLNLATPVDSPSDLLEGNALERIVYTALIVAGLLVLLKRKFNWQRTLSANILVTLFHLYCGLSVFWSDYTTVSLKRWVKEVGTLIMVFVVLSDLKPEEAVKALLRRWSYIVVPFSVLLIKYYPELGKSYSTWTGKAVYSGVTTSKNSLGSLCLIAGLSFMWSFMTWKGKKGKAMGLSYFILLVMVFWLFGKANSATSLICFLIGVSIILVTRMRFFRMNPEKRVHYILMFILCILALSTLLDVWEIFFSYFGRDPTLTGRTSIWGKVLNIEINPLIGTGFDSFWLGERARLLWGDYYFHINQSHNGYLEIYLNLGFIGLFLLAGIILSIYVKIGKRFRQEYDFASFRFAFLIIVVIYNLAEASFAKLSPIWFITLLIAIEYSHNPSAQLGFEKS